MNKRSITVWIAAFTLAAIGTFTGMRSQPQMWGFFVQLPGIAGGLMLGFLAASRSAVITRTLVVGTTVVVNAGCYFWMYRLLTYMVGKKRTSSDEVRS